MPNRLANETSPYLLQHQDNPVDWYPWGEEALARSRSEDKPIFLSIGYSACHWCHVMEHESFEDPQLAAYLNEHYVPIKVDREERPDLDQIYMNAVQMLTGQGGWPMSVFLTPDLRPFYGGTYWPPHAGRGTPGFDQVLSAVQNVWQNQRDDALKSAGELTSRIQSLTLPDRGEIAIDDRLLATACDRLEQDFDGRHGGFGDAPKFPQPMLVQLLLRQWRRSGRDTLRDMATLTLDKMHAGGIYDHLGGGFARYSVDEQWLVPHFEKMLYDNAQLASAYLDGFLATGRQQYAEITRQTLNYLLSDMLDPAGGLHSAEDADSEGEEGKFYVWKPEQVRAVLGEEAADLFCRVYDVTPLGNFEGASILNLPKPLAQHATQLGYTAEELKATLADARQKLLAAREQRPRPGKDDKVLTNWNGLALDALARAGAALNEPRYVQAAVGVADFLRNHMTPTPGRLLHSYRGGVAKQNAFLDDYTAVANGLISLYEATFDETRLADAAALLDTVLSHFREAESGAFYYTADDHEQLITRSVELTDNATPSGASLAATALLRLGLLTARSDYLEAAHRALSASASMMERVPLAMGQMLLAADLRVGPTPELLFTGPAQSLANQAHRRYLPRRVLAWRAAPAASAGPLDAVYHGKAPLNGEPTLYHCHEGACEAPIAAAEPITAYLASLEQPAPSAG